MRFGDVILGTGTGFIVNSLKGSLLITNRHVATGRHQDTGAPLSSTAGVPDNLVIWHNHLGKLGQWVARREALYEQDLPRWREHPKLGARADIIALPLTQLTDVQIYPYDLANPGPDIQVGPSDLVSVVGFPFGMAGGGLFAIWATGFLATEPIADFADLPVSLIDCRSRQGQSGSPVISFRSGGMVAMSDGSSAAFAGPVWRFIGVYSGRLNAESDLGIVWKITALVELVASV
jgi:S1-C subfamily serine protease